MTFWARIVRNNFFKTDCLVIIKLKIFVKSFFPLDNKKSKEIKRNSEKHFLKRNPLGQIGHPSTPLPLS